MIFITQLIFIREGQEQIFDAFEKLAIPIIAKYRGELLLRIRPSEGAYIESHIEKPYEIHLVQFETQGDFEGFMRDEERKQFLHLKDQSIKTSILIRGEKL